MEDDDRSMCFKSSFPLYICKGQNAIQRVYTNIAAAVSKSDNLIRCGTYVWETAYTVH